MGKWVIGKSWEYLYFIPAGSLHIVVELIKNTKLCCPPKFIYSWPHVAFFFVSKKTFLCPIHRFHLPVKELHVSIRHNKTNNFRGLGTLERFFFGNTQYISFAGPFRYLLLLIMNIFFVLGFDAKSFRSNAFSQSSDKRNTQITTNFG